MGWIIFIVIAIVVAGIFGAIWENQQKKEREEKLDFIASSIPDFEPSITINGIKGFYKFMVDKTNKKICYINGASKVIIPFDKIISVEYSENGTTLSSKSTMRTIGGTVVGGALAGGAGAVVGGLSGSSKLVQKIKKVQVKIRLRDISNPSLIINSFDAATMTSKSDGVKEDNMEGYILKQGIQDGKRITDIVSVIIDEIDKGLGKTRIVSNSTKSSQPSVADELKKLSDLKKEGVLTQEEFDQQKAKLLDGGLCVTNTIEEQDSVVVEDDLTPELRNLINEGRLIEAVKVYKDATGVSLAEAKQFIDSHR